MRNALYFMLCLFLSCSELADEPVYSIIPKPVVQEPSEGFLTFSKNPNIFLSDSSLLNVATQLCSFGSPLTSFSLSDESHADIAFHMIPSMEPEEKYTLTIKNNGVHIASGSEKGLFYGVQSLKQLLMSNSTKQQIKSPYVYIEDEPRFSYRGMHLDVARHMFPLEFIKKYLDLMAFHKYNTFHWHLTEDQGWRIEIKKYPKLQSIAAYRDETMDGHYSDVPRTFDGQKYGGYYTQEEIKEIIAYAAERYIEVIPEIEMPGHSLAALSAYPELACTPGPFKSATTWGVFEDVYCPKEETFTFLEGVLDEVMDLFPSDYIHIGGDECPKTRWKESDFCQKLIRDLQLKDEHELQSYFIQRMEKYVNENGKRIIGWDEILEGGLAPKATVMSWRGMQGGIEAAEAGHDVIMSPTTHCYFDYYQSKAEDEPLAIGGYLPLEKVYGFDPVPEELSEENKRYVLGAQCNLWTEYIRTPEKAEYMTYPRACALAEVNWSVPDARSYEEFTHRLTHHLDRLKKLDVNFADHIYDASLNAKHMDNGDYKIDLSTVTPNEIYYTLDGSIPDKTSTLYQDEIVLSYSAEVRAACYVGDRISRVQSFSYKPHLAKGGEIDLAVLPSSRYSGSIGPKTIIDGVSGGDSFNSEQWLGFEGADMEAVIQLNAPVKLSSIVVGSLESKSAWIYRPKSVNLWYKNEQGDWESLVSIDEEGIEEQDPRKISLDFEPVRTSALKVLVANHGEIESGQPGSGHDSWLFIDELYIQ